MGTISMIIGIISCIVAILGILGTILPELLSITAISIYGVPVLSVLGIIFGIIIRIKNNSDAEQKKRGRTGLLCSVLGVILYIVLMVCIVKMVGNWDVS